MLIHLNQNEIYELFKQSPSTVNDGGYQSLLVNLQRRINRSNGELQLSSSDLERIPRYAFDYGQGGWEDRIVNIFQRYLGPKLGR